MDFTVKDFHVRLRTIKLKESLIAYVIFLVISLFVCNYFNISYMYTIVFDLFMILFFIISLLGTRGFKKDFKSIFKINNLFRIISLAFIYSFFITFFIGMVPVNRIGFSSLLTISGSGVGGFLLDFVLTIVIAPISEELFYRGVLFNRLKIETGVYFALLVSSLIFGISHLLGSNIWHVLTATLFGMLMCVLYLRTDNILMSIGVHSVSNLLIYFGGIFDFINDISPSFTLVFFIFSAIFLLWYIVYFTYKYNS